MWHGPVLQAFPTSRINKHTVISLTLYLWYPVNNQRAQQICLLQQWHCADAKIQGSQRRRQVDLLRTEVGQSKPLEGDLRLWLRQTVNVKAFLWIFGSAYRWSAFTVRPSSVRASAHQGPNRSFTRKRWRRKRSVSNREGRYSQIWLGLLLVYVRKSKRQVVDADCPHPRVYSSYNTIHIMTYYHYRPSRGQKRC